MEKEVEYMKIKVKNMQCLNNTIIKFKKYACKDFEFETFRGKSSLGVIDPIKPAYANRSGKKVLLNKENSLWLQIGFKDLRYWLTGLYDENKNLIEFYFDITKKKTIDIENPTYEDLFLDLVYTKDKEFYILDEDELKQAQEENIITKDEYEKVINDCKLLKEYIENNSDILFKVCKKEVEELFSLLK